MIRAQKKILITAYDFYPNTGGVATYAWELAESLSHNGFQVLVLAKKRSTTSPRTASFRVQYVDLPDAGLLAYPVMARHILQIIKSWQPDKIICTLWMPGAIAAITARLVSRRTVDIYTVVHAMEVVESGKTLKKWLRARLEFLKKWTFKNVNKVFCVSNFTRQLVIENTNCSPEKIHVIHNGVNPQKFHPINLPQHTSEGWEKAYPILLTIARLHPHKGIDNMLRAMPQLKMKFPNIHYIVGGTGPDLTRLQAIAAELGLKNNVSFLGHLEDQHLPMYYSLADLFVLLSREEPPNVEGFGLVCLEAAACGTASLGGNSGGLPDAIIEGETGWLVNPLDPKQIADKLNEIFARPEIAELMGQRAQEYTLKNRRWQNVSDAILAHIFEHE